MVFLHGFQATHLKSKQLGDRCYYFDAEAPPTNVGHLEVSCFFFTDFWMSLALATHWRLSSFYCLFVTGDQYMHRKTARTCKCSDSGRLTFLKETARSQERLELGATNAHQTMSQWLLFAKNL